jgi:hypothetical protein
MKRIYVLRHADWDFETGLLTKDGIEKSLRIKSKLPKFKTVITSDFPRTKETAKLLSDQEPLIDFHASILQTTKEQLDEIMEKRETHPFGVIGVLFEREDLTKNLKKAGFNLIDLMKKIFDMIEENETALLVSHDGTILAAEKIIKGEVFNKVEKTYDSLEGYIIDEDLQTVDFKPKF